jgi:localization factor PodJL
MLNAPTADQKGDITGSITRPGMNSKTAPAQNDADKLPIAIGSAKLRNAAGAGDGAAAYEVAVRYAEGRGVPVSLEEAARWYERAASKGLAPAQFRYASQLEKGQGVKKDLNQARKLYLAAAAKGNAKAMHNLAVLYAEGIDGKPDYAAAAQWFRKAAQRGIADSQYNLGVLCARGLGTDKNYAESYQWFALAAIHGDKEAAKKRDEIGSQLDAATLATAQQTVKDFAAEPQPEDANAVPQPRGGWDQGTAASPPRVTQRRTPVISADMFDIGKR